VDSGTGPLSTKQQKCRILVGRGTTISRYASSVRGSSSPIVRLHRPDFYVALRKLIAKSQACPKSIQETSMMRLHSSIYSDDEMRIRHLSCDGAFHGIRQGSPLMQIKWADVHLYSPEKMQLYH
jgi:hypothetical protein